MNMKFCLRNKVFLFFLSSLLISNILLSNDDASSFIDKVTLSRVDNEKVNEYYQQYKTSIRNKKIGRYIFWGLVVAAPMASYKLYKSNYFKDVKISDSINYLLPALSLCPLFIEAIGMLFEPFDLEHIIKRTKINFNSNVLKSYALVLDPNAQLFDVKPSCDLISIDQIVDSLSNPYPKELNEFIQLKFYVNIIKANGQLSQDILDRYVDKFQYWISELVEDLCKVIAVIKIKQEQYAVQNKNEVKDKMGKEIISLPEFIDNSFKNFESILNSIRAKEKPKASLLAGVLQFTKELNSELEFLTDIDHTNR